ncbi:MAG: methyltransferase [Magnetococcales bacterium]|nr:methyltransferase [Magnetococcales bacterium]
MSADWSRRVRRSFEAASATYDESARIQQEAVRHLMRRIDPLELGNTPNILEIGCGTGFLSRALRQRWPQGRLLCTDLAPGMVLRCRQRLGERDGLSFLIMDGEHPAVRGGWDLVVSSLTWQWFADPSGALVRWGGLLRPGGWLALATLGEGTFREWAELCAARGVPCGVLPFPDAATLSSWWQGGGEVEEVRLTERHASGLAFLRQLRRIGAGVPREGHRPMETAPLRGILRGSENTGAFAVSYRLLVGLFQGREGV